jgi:hypothetical protein
MFIESLITYKLDDSLESNEILIGSNESLVSSES